MAIENELIIRLLVSTVIGIIVGVEREIKIGYAGMRTHALVCLGSTLFTSLSVYISSLDPSILARTDFTRIASQIVVGMGFLGGGVIFRFKNRVRGLTTAASLWAVAALGMIVGFGLYKLSIVGTVLVIGLLYFGRVAEESLFHTKR